MPGDFAGLTLRPYQLLCSVCSLGVQADAEHDDRRYVRGREILRQVAACPDIPVTLRCNAGFIYAYQDPGLDEDTPEGADYNRKRDLDILQRLDLVPGATLPARTLFHRLLSRIPVTMGVCGYREVTADAWRGCELAFAGNYERGVDRGIGAIVPPRDPEELVLRKRSSVQAIYRDAELPLRPHHLLCNVCNYGRRMLVGEPLPLKPLDEDNVIEFLDRVLTDVGVTLVLVKGADPAICAPCPSFVAALSACANVTGSGGLSNEKRDLDVLQRLGLTYGSRMRGGELYHLVFERIPSVAEICVRDNPAGADRQGSVWDSCDYETIRTYEIGRRLLMGMFA